MGQRLKSFKNRAMALGEIPGLVRGRSDGCTLAPDLNFRRCCVLHDRAYRRGSGVASRGQADADLRRCIRGRGHPLLAWTYWAAVRVFGRLFWKRR